MNNRKLMTGQDKRLTLMPLFLEKERQHKESKKEITQRNSNKLFSKKFDSALVFGRNLKRREEPRGFDYAFGGYPAGIGRLDKKIGTRKISHFFKKSKTFQLPIFSPSLPTPAG
jgi:hypothetical protein